MLLNYCILGAKSTVIWDVTPPSLAEVYDVSEERTGSFFRVKEKTGQVSKQKPPGEGSTFRRNVGKFVPDYTMPHPRR
jgi:hypothetical protein